MPKEDNKTALIKLIEDMLNALSPAARKEVTAWAEQEISKKKE